MARLDRDTSDGAYIGTIVVDSAGDWTDVTVDDWGTPGSVALPESAIRIVSLAVTETGGSNSAFLLLRAEAGEATTDDDVIEIPAGATASLGTNFSVGSVTTISVYGEARLVASLLNT